MEAAEKNGIPIPKLCYLKGINEIAACRVCVVELEGKEGTDHLLQQPREGRHGHPYEQPEGPESQKKYGPAWPAVPSMITAAWSVRETETVVCSRWHMI